MIGGVLDCAAMEALTEVRWQKPERYHCLSECGRYSVTKSLVRDVAKYQLWYRRDNRWEFDSMHDTFEAAKGAAR